MVTVVQLVRMSDCGSEGHRFDPDQSPQIYQRVVMMTKPVSETGIWV